MTTVAELERELAADTAAAYGIDVEKLRLIDLDMRRLAEQCILIHVRIEGVSQFRKAVPWELLGIAQKDVRRENITKGVLSYWPIAAVRSLESQEEVIRQCLKRFGHDIDGFAPFTCVRRGEGSAEESARSPYWTWRAEHAAKMTKWDRLVDTMLADYDEAKTKFQADVIVMAAEAYISMAARLRDLGEEPPDSLTWTQGVIDRAMAKFPTADFIRQSLKVSIQYRAIRNPLAVEELLTAIERARVERDAIEQEVLNSTVIQLIEIGSPMVQILNETVAELWRDAGEVLALIRDGRRFQHTTVARITGWKPQYLLMSGGRDAAVEAALDACVAAIPTTISKDANLGPLVEAITGLRAATRGAAEAMARIRPETWGHLVELANALGEAGAA